MKVLLIHEDGFIDGCAGGGPIAAYYLHCALRQAGVQSTLACARGDFGKDDIVQLPGSTWLSWQLRHFTLRMGINDIHVLGTWKLLKHPAFLEADVVNVQGWNNNMFNYLAVPRLAREKPFVATLHDMWHITGHCGYSMGCERWRTGCGKCPDLTLNPSVRRDMTRTTLRLKKWSYRKSNLAVVAASRWIEQLALEGAFKGHTSTVIPYGIPDTFHPVDKAQARMELGLNPSFNWIGIGAASLGDRRKGFDLFIEAVRRLPESVKRRTRILAMGSTPEAIRDAFDIPMHSAGLLRTGEEKRRFYAACDFFVCPSRYDNRPLVILEAMKCARPVVAFRAGGMPESVIEGETGLLAEPEDVGDLARAMTHLLEDPALMTRFGEEGRAVAQREYSFDQYARRYVAYFEQILAARALRGGRIPAVA